MLSALKKPFWRNGFALAMICICLWQVRQVSAQSPTQDIMVINFPVQGWYLLSLPLTVADSSVSTVFPTALGVFAWDNATSRYVQPTKLQTGRGYWVLMAAPTAVTISGKRFSQYRRHYLPGWHLIGSLIDSISFANPEDTPDNSVLLPTFAWHPGEQRYYATTTIEQSYGQWIAVLQECDVTVKPASMLMVTRQVAQAKAAPAKPNDKLSRQAFYKRFGAMPPAPFVQSSTAAIRPTTAKLPADNSKLFLESGDFEEPNPMLASLQAAGTLPRVLPMPPGSRIEFPDPLKSITSRWPERRLPGERTAEYLPAPPSLIVNPAPPAPNTESTPAQNRTGQIALQINTVPIHCDVIVDDKYVGQSPLTVYVDRRSSHIVQISRNGYEEKTKVLDWQLFGNETTYMLIEKLAPKR